jgi:hypothetical protein
MLFQKRVVRTKFDIYVFIINVDKRGKEDTREIIISNSMQDNTRAKRKRTHNNLQNTTTIRNWLTFETPWFILVLLLYFFFGKDCSVLCVLLCVSMSCAQCYWCLWIVLSWLSIRLSLMFILDSTTCSYRTEIKKNIPHIFIGGRAVQDKHQRQTNGQSRMDNPKTPVTLGTWHWNTKQNTQHRTILTEKKI